MFSDDGGTKKDIVYFRIPASSSAFFALATLTPPSPNPSISSIHSLDFDDFPIFFVDSVEQSSVESSPVPYQSDVLEDLSPESESLSSAGSFGTFGPRRDTPFSGLGSLYLGGNESVHLTGATGEDSLETPFPLSMNSLDYLVSGPPGLETCVSQSTISGKMALPALPSASLKDPSTPAAEGISSHNYEREKSDNPETNDKQRQEARPTQRSGAEVMARDGRPTAEKKVALDKASGLSRGTKEVEFVWLHGISIDLLIDQEGFRSTTPSFRYSGVDQTGCTVAFNATSSSKQGFYFHYNPFDASPILRRATIHGEESKDYISKQAQLTMKANGVYSVRGAEISSLPLMHSKMFNQLGHDPDKLNWEFKYLVDDRIDSHGRVVNGEKKFVPLTFTCSPWLLHPSQGKRVNLIHIFKKGVSAKLIAEKFNPPPVSIPEISIEKKDAQASPTTSQDELFLSGARFHRRALSHAVRDRDGEFAVPLNNPSDSSQQRDRGEDSAASRQVKRRASSAGEGSWLSMTM